MGNIVGLSETGVFSFDNGLGGSLSEYGRHRFALLFDDGRTADFDAGVYINNKWQIRVDEFVDQP